LERHINPQRDETLEPSPALVFANRCVRRGYAHAEMGAFATQMSSARWARREVHRNFSDIVPYLKAAPKGETVLAMEARVESASESELNNRGLTDFT
ncbi:MAG: hypothetical protein WD005_03105, partial [Haliea sp.]